MTAAPELPSGPATIKDVAKAAGLAISTVSAVINRSAPVSEDAIKRVGQAIDALGYIANGAARSLRSGKSSLIGLLVPSVANPIFGAVAREVEHFCFERGYTSVGPHADDLAVAIGDRAARTFASQGQTRAVVLAFKIGEIENLRAAQGRAPLLDEHWTPALNALARRLPEIR